MVKFFILMTSCGPIGLLKDSHIWEVFNKYISVKIEIDVRGLRFVEHGLYCEEKEPSGPESLGAHTHCFLGIFFRVEGGACDLRLQD